MKMIVGNKNRNKTKNTSNGHPVAMLKNYGEGKKNTSKSCTQEKC